MVELYPSQLHSADNSPSHKQSFDGQDFPATDEDPDDTNESEAEPNGPDSEDKEGTKQYNEVLVKQKKVSLGCGTVL